MDLKEVVLNYLTDNDERMKHLITWFLNEVMQEEADQQTGAGRYRRTSSRKAYRNGHREEWITSRRYLSGSDVIVCQDTRAEFTAL